MPRRSSRTVQHAATTTAGRLRRIAERSPRSWSRWGSRFPWPSCLSVGFVHAYVRRGTGASLGGASPTSRPSRRLTFSRSRTLRASRQRVSEFAQVAQSGGLFSSATWQLKALRVAHRVLPAVGGAPGWRGHLGRGLCQLAATRVATF